MSKELDDLAAQVASNAAVMQDAASLIATLSQFTPGVPGDDHSKLPAITGAMAAANATLANALASARAALSAAATKGP